MTHFAQFARNPREDPLVWYASYGSNLDRGRFTCYIQGGKPSGASRTYAGCSDTQLPRRDMAVDLPFPLYFAGDSPVWTGGVAFVGTVLDTGTSTKGRAYLITQSQFEQIAAQETHRNEVCPIDIGYLHTHGEQTIGTGRYDQILYCGERDGYPVLTMTAPRSSQLPVNRPAPAYLRMIASGLRQTHALSATEAARYLAIKPGVAGNYTESALLEITTRASLIP